MDAYQLPIVKTSTGYFTFSVLLQYGVNGQELAIDSTINGCGIRNLPESAVFCMSGSEDISSTLAGLTLVGVDDSQFNLISCIPSSIESECPGILYECSISDSGGGLECVKSIQLDGTLLTDCPVETCSGLPV